jgi:hypothetical protein
MIRYEFYGNHDILELGFENVGSAFIDLNDVKKAVESFPDDADPVSVLVDTQSVRDLFGYYGILERCPLESVED